MNRFFLLLFITKLTILQGLSQLTTFYVKPVVTNAAYASSQDSHYVAYNSSVTAQNKLLIFIGGTGSITKAYKDFPQLAANLGFHAVNIAYPNAVSAVSSCTSSSDPNCFEDFRQEICYGTPLSSSVSVDSLNSIYGRLVNLLEYLSATYPSQGWSQYLSASAPVWNKILTAGHSQGSGHALYFAKTNSIDRTIMFSGADDYSIHFNDTAPWIYNAGLTPVSKYYSFLDLQDDVAPYPYQYKVVIAMGLTASGDDSTLVDDKTSPYNHSHCLYTNATPNFNSGTGKYHGLPVVDIYTPLDANSKPLFTEVWTYMLMNSSVTGNVKEELIRSFQIYPNPASTELIITIGDHAETYQLVLVSATGKIISNQNYSSNLGTSLKLDVSELPEGIYYLRLNNEAVKFVKNH